MKLTLALKMTRQDLTRTQMELNTMKANFGDVVPRRDFEMQEKTNLDLQEQVLGGRVEFDTLGYWAGGQLGPITLPTARKHESRLCRSPKGT